MTLQRQLLPRAIWLILAVCVTFLAAETLAGYKYPAAPRGDVVDNYHGLDVADPYRWLEDPDSPETLAWVNKENELFDSFVKGEASRDIFEKRLTELWNYERYTLPEEHGERFYFKKNDGLQNQYVLFVQDELGGDAKLVMDPNTLSDDGTIALRATHFSHDGELMAYALSKSGSDWQSVKIRDLATGKDLDDTIEWTKWVGLAWKADRSGFYYNRFPEPGSVEQKLETMSMIYYHEIGTPQADDKPVFVNEEDTDLGYYPGATDDAKYLVLWEWRGTDPKNGVLYRSLESDGEFARLMPPDEAKYTFIDNIGTTFYFVTDKDAPRGRVIAVNLEYPGEEDWRVIVPESDGVVDDVLIVNNHIVVASLHDAHHRLSLYALDGEFKRDIELPAIGSISDITGEKDGTDLFFSFTSYLYPTTSFRFDFTTDEVTVFKKPDVAFDGSGYETKQVFYKSKDGTRVPMFITHKKGLQLDGSNPTLLYGYGGFNISLTPGFRVTRAAWIENGGVYCVANLRGGDEYGEEWHQAALFENKQNVFDDYIAAAEWLIDNKYTSPKRLAIEGGSNGGLLVAACMNQRPDLYGAVICRVPVTDMLRYHKFTVGRFWTVEYGNAEENPEHFKFLYAYSPLHNIKEGAVHPATLITTADTDDRVVPAHAKKYAAALQAADAGENPILIRVETKAGHGGGKPTAKRIAEAADIYAFIYKVMGLNPPVLGRN